MAAESTRQEAARLGEGWIRDWCMCVPLSFASGYTQVVRSLMLVQDLEEIEEWNEFGELKENIGPVPTSNAPPAGGVQGVNIRPADLGTSPNSRKSPEFDTKPSESEGPSSLLDSSNMVALPGAAEIAERNKAKSPSSSTPIDESAKVETMRSAPAEKHASINFAQEKMAKDHPSVDHLSAPASAVHSGTASPDLQPESETELKPTESAPAEPEAAARKHRGSDVREAPIEEIKKIESESALQEEDEEDETKEVTKGVEGVDVKDKDESVTKVDGPEITQQ